MNMIRTKYIETYFPIHDTYALYGIPKAGMFRPLKEAKLIEDADPSSAENKLIALFKR